MITFVRGSTNYLRALVTYDNGVPVTGATVTARIYATHGADLPGLSAAAFSPVADTVTYNYQLTVNPDQIDVPEGVLYSVEVLAEISNLVIRARQTLQVSE